MRGPSDVGCAHCKQLGAHLSCMVCKLQVCERCADPLTCSVPVGRTMTLDRGARLRAVDPRGKHALITQPLHGVRILDIRAGRWLGEVPLPIHIAPLQLSLTDDGRVLFRQAVVEHTNRRHIPLWMVDAATGAPLWREDVAAAQPSMLGVSPNQRYVWYSYGEVRPTYLQVLEPPQVLGPLRPLDAVAITAVAVDEARGLLATGGYRKLAVHPLVNVRSVAPLHGEASDVIAWLAFADHLISIVQDEKRIRIEQRELQPRLPARQQHIVEGTLGCAAVSRDGTHLAVSAGRTLHVIDLQSGARTMFEDHTDTISCVHFSADHMLVCGDDDRRIIVRPRSPDGWYARDLITLELSSS